MRLRLAEKRDLPQLKGMYERIARNMAEHQIPIWDEVYPCAFFAGDIESGGLYVLTRGEAIVAAFALCEEVAGQGDFKWVNSGGKPLYIARLGVNADYLRQGIGSRALQYAAALAKQRGAAWLRLLVVDINQPAIGLYLKSGFKQVEGLHAQRVDEGLILHEFGFAMALS